MPFYRRNELKAIAHAKLSDAQLLLNNGRWSNAYYLAGYSVEIGLKACIAKQISSDVIPDRNFINSTYDHDLKRLVGVAGLSTELKAKEDEDSVFAENWALVAQWTPETRYTAIDAYTSQVFIVAISDKKSGVFEWIQAYW